MIACAAIPTARNPDPHTMLIVSALTRSLSPPFSAACRAGACPNPAGSTQPMTHSSTSRRIDPGAFDSRPHRNRSQLHRRQLTSAHPETSPPASAPHSQSPHRASHISSSSPRISQANDVVYVPWTTVCSPSNPHSPNPQKSPTRRTNPPAIAPWWHTARHPARSSPSGPASAAAASTPTPSRRTSPLTYSQIMMSWMLFGSVVAGITLRSHASSSTPSATARSPSHENSFAASASTSGSFSPSPSSPLLSTQRSATSPLRQPRPRHKPNPPTPLQNPPHPALHFHRQFPPPPLSSKISFTSIPKPSLPSLREPRSNSSSGSLVSFTAAFCEEHIFRGYLLTQGLALFARIGVAPRLFVNAIAIVITSLIFGSLHLYEGVGGAVIIAALGCFYSVIALKFGNLRAVIAAHFLQDFVSGIVSLPSIRVVIQVELASHHKIDTRNSRPQCEFFS